MKKVLFITYDFPYPTSSGGKNRAYNMMKWGRSGIEIHLFSFIRKDFKSEYREELKKINITKVKTFPRKKAKSIKTFTSTFHPSHSVFYNLYFEEFVLNSIINYVQEEKIDVVHFESFYTGFYLSKIFKELGVKQVFGTENIEHKLYNDYAQSMANPILKPFYLREADKTRKEEIFMAQNSDITFAVTTEEAEYFKEVGAQNVAVIPNGVDLDQFKYKPRLTVNGTNILFVGNFSYFPNRDAVAFFYYEVFLKLPQKYKFTVIGKGACDLKYTDSRVMLRDFIPDIREAYYDADVFISPIKIGGGTNFKLIEAAACGVPIIAHPSRVASLGFLDGKDILTASTAAEFIEKIEILMNNDAIQGKLSKNARKRIVNNYSWKVIGEKLNKEWKKL